MSNLCTCGGLTDTCDGCPDCVGKGCKPCGTEMTDYTDGIEPHSEGIDIERSRLSDNSVAFNVLWRDVAASEDGQGRRLALRFACTSEQAAWDFADDLAAVTWVEEIPGPVDPLR